MAAEDPYEWPVGLRLVNKLLVDARSLNTAQVFYVDTNQVIAENPASIRRQAQIYFVENGTGFTPYWFRDGESDGDLKELSFGITPTGLEAIDEGNGIGWRLIGRNPILFGLIGLDAVDLSFGTSPGTHGATGDWSFAANKGTIAAGLHSAAFGSDTEANGDWSFVSGRGTKAQNQDQASFGSWNIAASADTIIEVGIGLSNVDKKNAFEIYKNGKIFSPEQTIALITDARQLVTKEYADSLVVSVGIIEIESDPLLDLQTNSLIEVGQAFRVTDKFNEEILIENKSPDGNTWFNRVDNVGGQTFNKVESIALIAPANFITTGKTTTTVDLSWDAVIGADTYEINVPGFGSFIVGDVTSYTVTGLTICTGYTFEAKAISLFGESTESSLGESTNC